MPILRLRHEMPFAPDRVWKLIDDPRLLLPASLPLLILTPLQPFPSQIRAGLTLKTRLSLFGAIPWGEHTIHYAEVDARQFSYRTEEVGTNIRRWHHRFFIEPTPHGCVCHDTIEFEAGWNNPVLWVFSHMLYRLRYLRRRQLLRKR